MIHRSPRSSRLILLGTLSVACGGTGKGTPVLEEISAPPADRIVAVSTATPGAHLVMARTVNSFGVAVPSEPLTATVTPGGGAPAQVELDASITGVGVAVIESLAQRIGDVSVASSSGTLANPEDNARAWALGLEMSHYALGTTSLLADLAAEPSHVAAGTGGVAVAIEDRVWWHSAQPEQPAYQVADMPFSVAGMVSGHLDRDGVLDLVVWSGNQAVALRGLAVGGYTWGGAWQATEGDIIGASIADTDSDRIADLTIGTSGSGSGTVTVLAHDGDWAFTPYEQLDINSELYSAVAADETGDGRPDVSVFTTVTGTVRRYTLSDAGWVGAQTSELPGYESFDGGALLPQADLDGDGVLETIVQGASSANTQDLVFFEIDPDGAGTINYPDAYGLFDAAVGDLDLDGRGDIVVVEEDTLHTLSIEGDGYQSRSSAGFGLRGPVAVGDYTPADLPDVAVASDALRFHPGRLTDAGEWSRETWDTEGASWVTYPTLFSTPIHIGDINNDGAVDLIGLQTDPDTGDVEVVGWSVDLSGTQPEISPLGTVPLVTSGTAHDLAVCGFEVYALVEGFDETSSTSGTRLARVRFSSSVGATIEAETTLTGGTLLSCGITPTGSPGVVVSSRVGFWTTHGTGLAELDSGDVGATDDILLADTDADGNGEVIGCLGENTPCSLLGIDLNEDGAAEVIQSADATSFTYSGGEDLLLADGGGHLGSGDFDGDGDDDVVAFDTERGLVHIWRNTGGRLSPAYSLHTTRPVIAAPGLADMTGDGVPELVFVNEEGRTVHTAPTSSAPGASW